VIDFFVVSAIRMQLRSKNYFVNVMEERHKKKLDGRGKSVREGSETGLGSFDPQRPTTPQIPGSPTALEGGAGEDEEDEEEDEEIEHITWKDFLTFCEVIEGQPQRYQLHKDPPTPTPPRMKKKQARAQKIQSRSKSNKPQTSIFSVPSIASTSALVV
jgi:hypothetical protein